MNIHDLYSSLPKWAVDDELVQAATESIQAHERLHHLMKTKLKGQPNSEAGMTVTLWISLIHHSPSPSTSLLSSP